MNELPDLRSDADVDALMARIQARIAGAAAQPPASDAPATPEATGPLARLVAAEEKLASTMLRALSLIAASLDEIESASEPTAAIAKTPPVRAKRAAVVTSTRATRPAKPRRRTK